MSEDAFQRHDLIAKQLDTLIQEIFGHIRPFILLMPSISEESPDVMLSNIASAKSARAYLEFAAESSRNAPTVKVTGDTLS